MDELKKKYRNVSQGTRQIQDLILSKKDDVKFTDNDIEILMRIYPERQIQDFEYLIIMRTTPFSKRTLYYKSKGNVLMNLSYIKCLKELFKRTK